MQEWPLNHECCNDPCPPVLKQNACPTDVRDVSFNLTRQHVPLNLNNKECNVLQGHATGQELCALLRALRSESNFSPVGQHEVSVLLTLTLGHVIFHLTDVPPRPNSESVSTGLCTRNPCLWQTMPLGLWPRDTRHFRHCHGV